MPLNNLKLFLFLFFCFSSYFSIGQQKLFPLSRDYDLLVGEKIYKKSANFHTSFKPYIDFSSATKIDDALAFSNRDSTIIHRLKHPMFWKKLRMESLIKVDSGDLYLTIDPMFDFKYGKDYLQMDSSYYQNTRGILVKGKIGKEVEFQTAFFENQAKFLDYISDYNKESKVVAGEGFPKVFKGTGYDYAYASGKVFYTPSKHFNFQLGHGKNFIGDGYRSLLLSDNSFNYPFFQITTNIWKIQYINLFTYFMDPRPVHTYTTGFSKKYGAFHYLSYNINKTLNISLFEGLVWQDNKFKGTRGYDLNYLNPIIFYHPVQASTRGEVDDNSVLGACMKITITNIHILYGQVVVDDMNLSEIRNNGFFQEKYGYQIGYKAFNLFALKNLCFQTEFNAVRPYTYGHRTLEQNYTHYSEALAHPLGANFYESVSFLNYHIKDFYIELKFNYAVYGADTGKTHWGQNIFKSDLVAERAGHEFSYGNYITQGVRTTLIYKDIRVGYLINSASNMRIELGVSDRIEDSPIKQDHTTYFYFCFRTAIFNHYYDF